MNLTLIGMSGAGKSFIGERVAERLGLDFLDVDTAIEEMQGKPLFEILSALGDEEFVRSEAKAAVELIGAKDNLLISTGGSIVYSPDAMAYLRAISKVVYLRVSFPTIEKRVADSADRVSRIVGLGKKTLRELFDERAPLYEKYAHHIIDLEPLDLEQSVQAVAMLAEDELAKRKARDTIARNE